MELVEQTGGAKEMDLFLFPEQHRSQCKTSNRKAWLGTSWT